MNKNNVLINKRSISKKIISWSLQIAVFLLLFFAISWWQQSDMLTTGEKSPVAEISLISIDGTAKHYNLNNQTKATFIYFFAPWCQVCHASIDNLEKIYQNKPKDLEILLIALDWQSVNQVDDFLTKHELSMPVLLGTNQIAQDFKIGAFPSYYLISKFGEIESKNMGYTTELGMRLRINN